MSGPGEANGFKPTDEQRAVIESEEAQILVEAGAGSGKTTTTVDRYIALLDRDPPLEPREILAFTFTDKAAGELRDKVRRARRQRAEETGDSNPEAVSMSDAWVGTFHAICTRILKAWPIEANIDPGFTVLDDTSGETLRHEAFDRALRRFCAEGESRYETIGMFREAPLRNCIQYAHEELRSRGIENPRLPDFTDTPFPDDHIAELKRLTDEALAGKLTEARRGTLTELDDQLERQAYGELRLDSNLGLRAGKNEQMVAIEAIYREVCDALARREADPVRRQLAELLELYDFEYREAKMARSALDYEDLQLFTLRLLRDNASIRGAYQQRFREVMVDEFQDTNLLQLDLVRELAGEATLMTVGDEMQSIYGFRHADVQLFRDRRQREAVRTYELTANFRSLPLVVGAVNRIGDELDRQVHGEIESAGRHEFKRLEVAPDADTGAPVSASILLTERAGWKPLDLGDLAPEGDPEVGKAQDHYNEAEALAVAAHLRDLVDDEGNEIGQGDIAVLLRAKTRTDLYVEALRQFGLMPYVVAGRGFWHSREAVELRALLAVLANPLDDNNLLGALTSPACGLSSDALWLLRRATPPRTPLWPTLSSVARATAVPGHDGPAVAEAAGWLEQVPDEDLEKATAFVEVLDSLRRRAVLLPLDELIEQTITATGYDLANLIRDPSANGLATIRRVASLAREFEAGEGRDLRAFLNWAELSEELDSEAPAATADEASDVVRIMTVHAAKGLEFKVACVPDLGRMIRSSHDHALSIGRSEDPARPERFSVGLGLPRYGSKKLAVYDSDVLKQAGRIANRDEELRLLHVAMTRAEDHLVLSGVLPEKWPKEGISPSTPMITRISQAFDLDPQEPEEWPLTVPVTGGEIKIVRNQATAARAEKLRSQPEPVPSAKKEKGEGQPPIVTERFQTHPDVPLSFSAFAEFIECPARFYAHRVMKLTEPGTPARPGDPDRASFSGRMRATRFGTAVHSVLERLAKDGWPELDREMVEASLTEQGLSGRESAEKDTDDAVVTALRMVEGFIGSDLGAQAKAAETHAEMPLLLSYGDVTIRGSADLVLEGEPPLIIDYKTDRLNGQDPGDKMGPYELQRGLYALALARARGIGRVKTAYVFLNRPDEPVVEVLDKKDSSGTEALLKETLSEITSGRFFGGPSARYQPCGDCQGCVSLAGQIARAAA